MASETIEGLIVAVSILVLPYFFYKKKSLDKKGAIAAIIVGVATYFIGGFKPFSALLFMFILADLATRFGRQKKKENYERRSITNIVGNYAAAFIALVLGIEVAFFGAISAALADTFSTELGSLSKTKPKLITTFEEVEKGTDGGVTILGFLAAVFGAGLIAGTYYYYNSNLLVSGIIVVAGFFGSVIDSFLGAIFERNKKLDNTQVNFLASLGGALIAYGLKMVL